MENEVFLRQYRYQKFHRFREIERYARILQEKPEECLQKTDDTEASF